MHSSCPGSSLYTNGESRRRVGPICARHRRRERNTYMHACTVRAARCLPFFSPLLLFLSSTSECDANSHVESENPSRDLSVSFSRASLGSRVTYFVLLRPDSYARESRG